MKSKYNIKTYLLLLLFISPVFAQTLQRNGNLIKLNDGRIIEYNKLSKASQNQNDFTFKLKANKKLKTNKNHQKNGNLFQNKSNKKIINDKNIDNKNNNGKEFISLNNSIEEERNIGYNQYLKGIPNNQNLRSASTSLFLRGNSDSLSFRETSINQTLKSSPINIIIHEQSQSYIPSPIPVNQSLRTPTDSSLRGSYSSKSNRLEIDDISKKPPLYYDNNPHKQSPKSDTQAFDIDSLKTDQNPNNSFNLQDSTPSSRLNTQDTSNINNNNINLNLYNLTNLLDQFFSKERNNFKKREIKKNEIRTDAWEDTYRNILNQEALSIIKKPSNNHITNKNSDFFHDFIIKLPLLYDLIYGDRKIRPPDKPVETQPYDSQKDDEGYYKKSVGLLKSILKSFPDINKNTVNVIIITNAGEKISPRKNEEASKGSNNKGLTDYYNGIDPQYQKEFEKIRKKYNYNIGLELAQIRKLFLKKEYSLVLKKLHQLEKIDPYNTRIKNIIGSTYYKIGFYEFAQRYWQESIYLDPNQPLVEAYLDRISQYGSNDEYDLDADIIDP